MAQFTETGQQLIEPPASAGVFLDRPGVRRHPLYIPTDNGESVFGWFHDSDAVERRDCVAVICAPIGFEYAHIHRSVRHMADQLASQGIPALRFDYRGTGDSPGTDLDPARIAAWRADIRNVVGHVRSALGRTRICLIGIRFGATLAASVAAEVEAEWLVLWSPVVSGRRYLREMQAIAASATRSTASSDVLESGGFALSEETMDAMRGLDMLKQSYGSVKRVLVLGRDDLAAEPALNEHLSSVGVANDYLAVSGYVAMMAEAQFTQVPQAALRSIGDWLVAHTALAAFATASAPSGSGSSIVFDYSTQEEGRATLEETLCSFGPEEHLFGILSRPADAKARGKSAIILFNAGAVHHVGPNRLYVTLAREFAAQGHAALRFDLSTLGDSVPNEAPRENHPYPVTTPRDARAAVEFMQKRFGYQHFVLLGLCSGAHTAFHGALALTDLPIAHAVVINPLTYHWVEGMGLATSRRFQDMSYYKGAARNPTAWLKLLRGQVNLRKPLKTAFTYLATGAASRYRLLLDLVMPGSSSKLSADLYRLYAMRRPMNLIISEDDPGYDILMANARRTATKGLRDGHIQLHRMEGADHTFSNAQSRRALIERLRSLLESKT